MSTIPEWVDASDGTLLHRTTIQCRIDVLGWTRAEAMSRPVREVSINEGASIASRARADMLTPGKVQMLMRLYGVTYEEAATYLRANASEVRA